MTIFSKPPSTLTTTDPAVVERGPLLTLDQLEALAATIAGDQHLQGYCHGKILEKQLALCAGGLKEIQTLLSNTVHYHSSLSETASWLLDNFYILEARIRTLQKSFARLPHPGLPALKNSTGNTPRVFHLVSQLVAHTEGQVNREMITRCVAAYGEVSILQLTELRLLPSLLQLALLENVRRLATKLSQALLAGGKELTDRDAWSTSDRILLRNYVSSMRVCGAADWRPFFTATSIVEEILATDPAGIYKKMDYYSKNACCRRIEQMARQSHYAEHTIAALAIQMADKAAASTGISHAAAHVGYYLLGNGKVKLEQAAQVRKSFGQRCRQNIGRFPLLLYAGFISLFTLAAAFLLLRQGALSTAGPTLQIIAFLLLLIACSQMAVTLVNRLASIFVQPSLLPRLDLSEGIPDEHRTLVVVPAILSNPETVSALLQALEIRYLGNRQQNLHFALLSDLKDAATHTLTEDAALLQQAMDGIDTLNKKYNRPNNDLFYFLHRPRRWCASEGVWMGHERKRGKIADLAALLQDNDRSAFSHIAGDASLFPSIRYVITLDADTQLPRDTAWKLIGAMAHPLNQPVFDNRKKRVVQGYGILQPRIGITQYETTPSRYVRMQGNDASIDPYTRLISDVYQDLFGEGSYIGKGIFDVAMYHRTLHHRFPDNRILSHDLLEGCYLRAGLISDVQLFEQNPAAYYADTRRHHRWIRGDWQLLPYLFPRVPEKGKGWQPNTLSPLSWWKIFDNLRRSLVPAALLLFLVAGWTMLQAPLYATLIVLGMVLFPSMLSLVTGFFSNPSGIWQFIRWRRLAAAAIPPFQQSIYAVINLPHEAWYTLDAVTRTLWRRFISRKKLLEWHPSGDHNSKSEKYLSDTYRLLWISPVLAVVVFVLLLSFFPAGLWVAGPVLLGWAAAPAVTWWVSRTPETIPDPLNTAQRRYLHILARKTWSYFDQFMAVADNWLPPDYYQEYPLPRISHRTSPTNMGLGLLAQLSAHDFGYTTKYDCLERIRQTLGTMNKLERYQGHFFNWYDTHSLQPVQPRYVSTVDSGNLLGHLLVLRQGLLAMADHRIFPEQYWQGLLDTLVVLEEQAGDPSMLQPVKTVLEELIAAPPAGLYLVKEKMEQLLVMADTLEPFQHQCMQLLEELNRLAPWLQHIPDPPLGGPGFLASIPTIKELAGINVLSPECTTELRKCLQLSKQAANELLQLIRQLADQCQSLTQVSYDFLFNKEQQLLSIGFNADRQQMDAGCYDMLASEARVATFIAIAQGQLPQESWFAMNRPLLSTPQGYVLLSWSGSMFEYLMPDLIMPSFPGSLLQEAGEAAVQRQIAYGKERQVCWGISECANSEIDINLAYQYGPCGVPGLGLQRGIGEDLLIAPYASLLALLVAPSAACNNLQQLSQLGLEAAYGFYESIDYTPHRIPKGSQHALVRSFMTHHQGIGLLSLNALLLRKLMQQRFEAEPIFKATLMLLQEKLLPETAFPLPAPGAAAPQQAGQQEDTDLTVTFSSPHTPAPEVSLLSNGRYHVMISQAGGGYSKWKDISVIRWRNDYTLDNTGLFCYVQDLEENKCWSAAFQPSRQAASSYSAHFSIAQAGFTRTDDGITTTTTIAVSPEDDLEIRRLIVTNTTDQPKRLAITSYAEVVLTLPADDSWHPAFSNLFVQTQILPSQQAILAQRRPRTASKPSPWLFHIMKVYGAAVQKISYETDRLQFLGRCRNLDHPQALQTCHGLSNTDGSVLDPIIAIQYQVLLPPGASITCHLLLGIAENREQSALLIDKYQQPSAADRIFELVSTRAQAVLKKVRCTAAEWQLFRHLAGSVLYPQRRWRAGPATIAANTQGQHALFHHAISGDHPLVLVIISSMAGIELAEQLVKAYTYWQLHGLAVDLVIWNDHPGDHAPFMQDHLLEAAAIAGTLAHRRGNVTVMDTAQLSEADAVLLQAIASVVLSDKNGSLPEQCRQLQQPSVKCCFRHSTPAPVIEQPPSLPHLPLHAFNGTGGFGEDGKEYIITLQHHQTTPMPWCNVLANPHFGTVISESGQAYTWYGNAHEYRLTPWNNDAVCDPSGEAFYLRDESAGNYWSPVPFPARGTGTYSIRHGFGYSRFDYEEQQIQSSFCVFTHLSLPVKYQVLRLHNNSNRTRTISITGYCEWLLGDLRSSTASQVVTALQQKVMLAMNRYSREFPEAVSFFHVSEREKNYCTNRSAFIGQGGSLQQPLAMYQPSLNDDIGATSGSCTALQVMLTLEPGVPYEVVFVLGTGTDATTAIHLAKTHADGTMATAALVDIKDFWNKTMNVVRIETPDTALNFLQNGWLPYQVIAGRLWGRSGFYQSSGAFGFRDQLQDVLSLLHTAPALAREHILLCARHQFPEGDVLHWWHPPGNKGVRTRCSDDYCWLPYATCRYVQCTGDHSLLYETIPFLEGGLLGPGEESRYNVYEASAVTASVYEHCVRAIRHALNFGEHGLPLIGSCDWNDGMDRVGIEGKGESVWLGFFLYEVLQQFGKLAATLDDTTMTTLCTEQAAQLRDNLALHGWDGAWYRRAYYDNGQPLGSAASTECRIDALSQSWAVLSGAASPVRSITALESAYTLLVDKEAALIKTLDPPFDKSKQQPGYIKGYVPGVRENGAQYTHAAIWMIMAFAQLGDRERVEELVHMINPVHHADTPEKIMRYKTEPYVMAADVYSSPQHSGRGGWTWYTGAAGWMYQLVLEHLAGLQRRGNTLRFKPCLPASWTAVTIHYRFQETMYQITIQHSTNSTALWLDDELLATAELLLINDGREHRVTVHALTEPQQLLPSKAIHYAEQISQRVDPL